jgi:hypothetical protein
MLRNEHHSSRMQIALLISDMSVDGAFLDKHDLVLLNMLMGWYGCAGGISSPATSTRCPEPLALGVTLRMNSPASTSPGSGRQRRVSPSFFSSSSAIGPFCVSS